MAATAVSAISTARINGYGHRSCAFPRSLRRKKPSPFGPTRHPVLDTVARQAVLDQVRAAATGNGPVSADVAVVLALAGLCRLLERVAPDRVRAARPSGRSPVPTRMRRSRRASPRLLTS